MGVEIILVNPNLNGIILAWLAEHLISSERTADTYAGFLVGWKYTKDKQWSIKSKYEAESFCFFLQTHQVELTAAHKDIAYYAQAWAAMPNSRTGKTVSASTHNLKLAALASFYEYAIRHEEYPGPNPIDRVKRIKREIYSGAHPLVFDNGELFRALDSIPTNTDSEIRDKAMLYLALYTGRRLSEIANLRCGDIQAFRSIWYIHWTHTKGGKTAKNELRRVDCPAIDYLEKWLKHYYGKKWPDEAYVFPSLAQGHKGGKMTPQGIEQRCDIWLETSKFHQLRHTFSAMYLEAGGTIHELSSLLGHSSIGVTGTYVPKLTEGKNDKVAKMRDIMEGKKHD